MKFDLSKEVFFQQYFIYYLLLLFSNISSEITNKIDILRIINTNSLILLRVELMRQVFIILQSLLVIDAIQDTVEIVRLN